MNWIAKKEISRREKLPWFERKTAYSFPKPPVHSPEPPSALHRALDHLAFSVGLPLPAEPAKPEPGGLPSKPQELFAARPDDFFAAQSPVLRVEDILQKVKINPAAETPQNHEPALAFIYQQRAMAAKTFSTIYYIPQAESTPARESASEPRLDPETITCREPDPDDFTESTPAQTPPARERTVPTEMWQADQDLLEPFSMQWQSAEPNADIADLVDPSDLDDEYELSLAHLLPAPPASTEEPIAVENRAQEVFLAEPEPAPREMAALATIEKTAKEAEIEQNHDNEILAAGHQHHHTESERASITPQVALRQAYRLPPTLLHSQKISQQISDPREIQQVIQKLEETLNQFNIDGRVVGFQQGPIITRYEVKMPPGIKVSRILSLTDELAMALEAMKVRIEAPIPGRSTVGIEIPNKSRARVLLGDLLNDPNFSECNAHLPLPMGLDIAGNLMVEDLVNMPHLLIAGATGSGKSVAVNSFITSLILNKSPEEVRFILVDPKLVELSHYNDIPHLLHPVITDHQKAILALNWAVEEMERRYEDMAELRARDIRSYNEKIRSGSRPEQPMPYIVILIDELGDLMMVAGKEVENSIIRLAQKARAIGIHLILATQRPSVDVITALIKANCPARIALQVAQKTDSRTILDSNGAEQLLGKGDMLFKHPSRGQLIRIQAPLVLDTEVEEVVARARQTGKPAYIVLEDPKAAASQLDPEDENLFEEAWQIIVESQKASASYLQRRLRIGYNRAARIIEAFEARGYIGPQVGSKPREILA